MTFEETLRALVRDAVREALADLRSLPTAATTSATPGSAPASSPRYLSTDDAAEIAGVKPGTVRRWLQSGKLRTHRAGRMLRVRLDELQAFMAGDEADEEPSDDEIEARAITIVHGKR